MELVYEIRRRFVQILYPVVGACLLAYFAYHTVQGDRGLLAYWRISQEVEKGERSLAMLQERRLTQERRVALLRGEQMDIDLLEERSRSTFNLVHPDDLVIYLKKNR